MKLQRSVPEKQGVKSQAIIDFLCKIKEENHELHSFMLLKNGKVISECWWQPYAPQYRHQLFSLSKSFTSSAIGMAVSEGLLTTDTLLVDIFKEETAELGNDIDEKMKRMTMKHILMMSTGTEYENWNFWGDMRGNNIKNFLSSHVKHEPGSVFFYHTLATYMQSAAITRLTGQTLTDYLKPRLFSPLGITDPYWEKDNLGICYGGFGLNIKTEEIAKFGQLYLQKGIWNGKRLISEDWINEATSKQIDNAGNNANASVDWSQGYGYQFWRCVPAGVYRGDGMYGQFCIVMPDANAVIAITSNVDMQRVQDLIWEILLPALRENREPYEDKAACAGLLQAQKNLSHLKTNAEATALPKMHAKYKNGKVSAYLDINEADGILALDYKNSKSVFKFKKGEWTDNAALSSLNFVYPFSLFYRCKVYSEWKPAENTLELTLWYYETPRKVPLLLKFNKTKNKLTVVTEENNVLSWVTKTYELELCTENV
ncbi:MAG: beta-lactamase family protein [Oscillospiraceae bacterium]|nr:beta-lactamase family protein [Oscillospiraceae bacterium]